MIHSLILVGDNNKREFIINRGCKSIQYNSKFSFPPSYNKKNLDFSKRSSVVKFPCKQNNKHQHFGLTTKNIVHINNQKYTQTNLF
jgi:hypothetical protein